MTELESHLFHGFNFLLAEAHFLVVHSTDLKSGKISLSLLVSKCLYFVLSLNERLNGY